MSQTTAAGRVRAESRDEMLISPKDTTGVRLPFSSESDQKGV
jgi:hypothetical protein